MRTVGVGERVAADALGHADDRVREHLPVLIGAVDLDERADRRGRVGEHAVDDVGELGVVARRCPEEQPERGAVVLDEMEVGGEALLDPGPAGLDARRRLGQHLEQASTDVLEHRDEQRPLRREVLVEDRLGDARREREIVHRGRVEASLRELDARDVEQLATPLVGRESRAPTPGGVPSPAGARLQGHLVAVGDPEVVVPELVERATSRRR